MSIPIYGTSCMASIQVPPRIVVLTVLSNIGLTNLCISCRFRYVRVCCMIYLRMYVV